MENIKAIIANIKKQYSNISISHKNQCPCHLQQVAALELVSRKPVQVSSDQEQREQDGVGMVSEQELRLTYSELFMKQREPKWQKLGRNIILVQGEAGMGKSVLCTLIINDWASGKQFQEFSVVLLLPLHQYNVASASSLLELVTELYKFNGECCSSLANFLGKSASNILIIADGWDQLIKLYEPEELKQSFLHKLLFGNLYSISCITVVITSRPIMDPAIFSTLQSVSQFVTIKGFSRAIIQSCVESEFSSELGKCECLTKQIEDNPLVEILCRVPVNLALICSLYRTCSKPLPYTMSELYSRLIWSPLRISNSACVAVKNHYDLSEEMQQSWWFLCELAFTNIKKVEASKYTSSKISHFGLLKSVLERQNENFSSFFILPFKNTLLLNISLGLGRLH